MEHPTAWTFHMLPQSMVHVQHLFVEKFVKHTLARPSDRFSSRSHHAHEGVSCDEDGLETDRRASLRGWAKDRIVGLWASHHHHLLLLHT